MTASSPRRGKLAAPIRESDLLQYARVVSRRTVSNRRSQQSTRGSERPRPSAGAQATSRLRGRYVPRFYECVRFAWQRATASASTLRFSTSAGSIAMRRRSVGDYADSKFAPTAFVDTVRMCEHQKNQLLVSRTSQMGTVHLRCRRDVGTAFYGVLRRHPTLYACLAVYACVACAARAGALPADAADAAAAATTGLATLVSFTVVFFFGYAYDRNRLQFGHCMSAIGAVLDTFMLLRPALDRETLLLLWCLVNCAHVCGFPPLQTVYTQKNLFDPFCIEHKLFDNVPNARAIRKRIDALGIDASSDAVRELLAWSLSIVMDEYEGGKLNHATYQIVQERLLKLRSVLARIADHQFQVIPYMYLHLTGAMVAAFLLATATQKAALFGPEADALFGLALPLAIFLAIAFSMLGLLELGGQFMNPLGGDEADLAVLKFLTSTVEKSRAIVDTPADMYPPRRRRASSSNEGFMRI